MLRRIRDPEKGASFVEYAAVIALVGIIIASLLVSGIPRQISDEIAGAVDEALNTESTDLSGGGAGARGGTGAPESSGGASGSPGGEGARDLEEVPDSGLPGPGEVDAVPYDLEEHTGGATPAVWNGGDGFTVQQTLSWGDILEWGSDGNPLFTFEDQGDYNWYCGEILLSICYLGGGLAQGTNEAAENTGHTLCHLRIGCTKEEAKEAKEAWAGTGQGVQDLVTDPKGSLEGMWDGFWATPEQNREDLSGQGAFWKDSGYWIPQMMGAPFRAFRLFGENGRSSDRDGAGRSRGGSDCSNSFTPGTLVVLADGTAKPIELIQVGDLVLAASPETGEQGPREVTHLIPGGGDKTLVDVTVDNGSSDTASVTATDNHPFWVSDQGWTEAIDLESGNWLRTSAGVWVQVTAVDVHPVAEQTVHNLTVEDLHTYHVLAGQASLLVHNSAPCPEIGQHQTNGEPADGPNLERSAQVGDDQWQFKTGHGFNREHNGPNNVRTDLRDTNLTPDQIEQSIVNDVYTHIDNGGTIPEVGGRGYKPYEGTTQVDGHNIGYRVSKLPDGRYSLATYFLIP